MIDFTISRADLVVISHLDCVAGSRPIIGAFRLHAFRAVADYPRAA